MYARNTCTVEAASSHLGGVPARALNLSQNLLILIFGAGSG